MVLGGSLNGLFPHGLQLGGALGLASILGFLFPYLHRLILYLFNFNVTEDFGKLFGQNSFLGTSFGIVGIGAGVAALQALWNHCWQLYAAYFSISLEIPSSDATYWDILHWVHSKQMKNPKHLSLQTVTRQNTNGKWETCHDFVPSIGTHLFRFGETKFSIQRQQAEKGADAYGRQSENIILSATGKDTNVFRSMLEAVKRYKAAMNQGKTMIYTVSQGHWVKSGSGKRKRPMESVILSEGVAERILADIKDFTDGGAWYTEFGVPYRRGYLLYGPPGTGKTSFISAVAGHFGLNVCILNLSDKSLTDDLLNSLLICAPESSLVLLEDIDAAFGSRNALASEPAELAAGEGMEVKMPRFGPSVNTAFQGLNRLTFSGLLNALDGVASAEGRILFMTTNYIDRIDSALIRPGRVDHRQFVDYASENQVERMFRRFYRGCSEEEAERFVKAVFDRPKRPDISLAGLQGLFLQYRANPAKIFNGISMLY